jgi:hypothetical protein
MKKIYNLLIATVIMFTGSCASESGGSDSSYSTVENSTGKGGSMARFCIIDNLLFTVDNNSLKLFNISKPENPDFFSSRTQFLDFGIETIFPMDSLLFIGSQTGMYIYQITDKGFLKFLSNTSHIRSCDPVVAQGNYAYVTLNSNNIVCGRNSNLLQIYDITNLTMPVRIKEIEGFYSPMGLGIDGDKLFVCDNGLKVYEIRDGVMLTQVADLHSAGIHDVRDAYDVIPFNGLLILVTSSGIYQMDYTGTSLKWLSEIKVKR